MGIFSRKKADTGAVGARGFEVRLTRGGAPESEALIERAEGRIGRLELKLAKLRANPDRKESREIWAEEVRETERSLAQYRRQLEWSQEQLAIEKDKVQ